MKLALSVCLRTVLGALSLPSACAVWLQCVRPVTSVLYRLQKLMHMCHKESKGSQYIAAEAASRHERCRSNDITGVPPLHKKKKKSAHQASGGTRSTVLADALFTGKEGKNEGGVLNGGYL